MNSKYVGIGMIVLLVGVIAFSGCTQNQQNIPPNTVMIQNFAFNPNSITVKVGTNVTWVNQDSASHTIVGDNGTFQSNNLANGANYTYNFTKAGEYSYHCSIHPSMVGKIIVQS